MKAGALQSVPFYLIVEDAEALPKNPPPLKPLTGKSFCHTGMFLAGKKSNGGIIF
jgi:hypothetical protein